MKDDKSRLLLFISIIIFTLLIFSAPVRSEAPAPSFKEYQSTGDYFSCHIPVDWNRYEPVFGLSEEEKKIYGLTLFGPTALPAAPPTFSVHYYAPGNRLHESMKKFVLVHAKPVLGFVAEGKSYGEVREIEFAGRKAQTFDRLDIRYIGERSLHPQKVSVFERFIVAPDEHHQGFYALKLSVPLDSKEEYLPIFDRLTKSFTPRK
ncbi:MAG: hypothetical protein M0P04_04765 [Syntrophales bacterium]|jgi:hypothetical protein|nr:hypothetical protein [Syntrophales bacterium]MDD4339946.1 hypothetical protein [Syntrophales bacterium]HOG07473.1 hypothetical protein [Syntrophales bacterium]HOS77594.1 hypothetical protein [Syntrophales bacterium]HPB70359.1 hypothetical protein [Syntrophales bacterium]